MRRNSQTRSARVRRITRLPTPPIGAPSAAKITNCVRLLPPPSARHSLRPPSLPHRSLATRESRATAHWRRSLAQRSGASCAHKRRSGRTGGGRRVALLRAGWPVRGAHRPINLAHRKAHYSSGPMDSRAARGGRRAPETHLAGPFQGPILARFGPIKTLSCFCHPERGAKAARSLGRGAAARRWFLRQASSFARGRRRRANEGSLSSLSRRRPFDAPRRAPKGAPLSSGRARSVASGRLDSLRSNLAHKAHRKALREPDLSSPPRGATTSRV